MSSSWGWEQRMVGVGAPKVMLPFTPEASVSLATLSRILPLVVFFYPGARQQSNAERQEASDDVDMGRAVAWDEHCPELDVFGYMVVGVSTQSPEEQIQFAVKGVLGYLLLSDSELELARVLGLPTVSVAGERVYDRLTLIVQDGRIARVFYPVDPARDAAIVSDWIRRIHA